MFDFERPNIEVAEISEDKKYGRFVVEPLERGYGNTPSILTWLTAAPGKEESIILLKEFPSVIP